MEKRNGERKCRKEIEIRGRGERKWRNGEKFKIEFSVQKSSKLTIMFNYKKRIFN